MTSGESWRIVLFSNAGHEDWVPNGKALLDALGHRLVGVVTSPGPKSRRSDDYLKLVHGARQCPDIDIIISNHPSRWAGLIAPLKPDLLISVVFSWKIPAETLAVATHGGINSHPSALPKYRGPNPVGWAIRNGDERMYLTIHRLTPEFDGGAILAQESFPLLDEDDDDSLQPKFAQIFATTALPKALGRIAAGDPGTPQDDSQATLAPLFEESWRHIDWSQSRQHISRQIRSWIGGRDIPKGALGEIGGRPAVITKARPLNVASDLQPGEVCARWAGGSLVVQCGDGPLEILAYEALEDSGAAGALNRESISPSGTARV